MRNYQLVLVANPSLNDSQRKKVVDGVKNQLKDLKITKEEDWGQKPLAYKIKREATGHYFNFLMETEGKIPDDLEKRLFNTDELLRHLLIRVEGEKKEKKEAKSRAKKK